MQRGLGSNALVSEVAGLEIFETFIRSLLGLYPSRVTSSFFPFVFLHGL